MSPPPTGPLHPKVDHEGPGLDVVLGLELGRERPQPVFTPVRQDHVDARLGKRPSKSPADPAEAPVTKPHGP